MHVYVWRRLCVRPGESRDRHEIMTDRGQEHQQQMNNLEPTDDVTACMYLQSLSHVLVDYSNISKEPHHYSFPY